MDLGISSYQIDYNERGFSIGNDGPLDMRMNRGTNTINTNPDTTDIDSSSNSNTLTAATIINEWDGDSIASILYDYGDETRSRQIAREIIMNRPISSTHHLVQVISRILPYKQRPQSLSRCFQALRIVVNDELAVLEEALTGMHSVLRPGKHTLSIHRYIYLLLCVLSCI